MARSIQQPLSTRRVGVTANQDNIYVEAVARRVAELIHREGTSPSQRLVDAATLAIELGVERSWIYEHAAVLRPIRLGNGPKARLRFDPHVVRKLLAADAAATNHRDTSDGDRYPSRSSQRAPRRRRPVVGQVLAVRPQRK
jgi:hypothetical protein